MSHDFPLCRVEHLVEGRAHGMDPNGLGFDNLFVLVTGGEVRAYLNSCPHLDVRLEYRKDRFLSADGQRIICYAHGAQFLPKTGLCVFGPCIGQFLRALDICCEDGWVWLALDHHGQPIEVSRGAMGSIRLLD